ncbi:MAG: hypothetical protein MJ185_05050 [Treponema sp.]|nr:hypothetical protein [Treponema sp.]
MLDFEKIRADFEAAHKDEILPPMSITTEIPAENKLVILIDIVGFSKGTTKEQVYKIYCFEHYVIKNVLSNFFNFKNRIRINQFISTGDGCYIVADECDPKTALDFLVALISGFQYIEKDDPNPWALRASALFGECVPILDLAKHKNYIGEGMNEAARVLSYGQAALEKKFLEDNPEAEIIDAKLFSRNSLYTDESLSEELKDYVSSENKIFHFDNISDKHGKTRNVTVLQGLK